MKAQTVLVVEDNELLSDLIVRRMQREYTVELARTGNEVFDVLDNHHIDLIILDLVLSGMHGFDILARIKEDKKTAPIPVIILSNLDQESDIKKCEELGAARFLVKIVSELDVVADAVKEELQKVSKKKRA